MISSLPAFQRSPTAIGNRDERRGAPDQRQLNGVFFVRERLRGCGGVELDGTQRVVGPEPDVAVVDGPSIRFDDRSDCKGLFLEPSNRKPAGFGRNQWE